MKTGSMCLYDLGTVAPNMHELNLIVTLRLNILLLFFLFLLALCMYIAVTTLNISISGLKYKVRVSHYNS